MTHQLCEGLGMVSCYSCGRCIDNHPGHAGEPTLRPAADPPAHCMDWRPMPITAPQRRTEAA